MQKISVLLDSSFILTCAKQKVDFFDYLEKEGIEILIPSQVINEIERISEKGSGRNNKYAKISLLLLKNSKFKKIDLIGKNVDNAIINFAKQNPDLLIATLDKEIQKKTRNKKLIIRGKKKLEIKK